MTQGFFLTPSDGEIIRQVVQEYRRTPKGQPSYGVPGDLDGYPPDDLFTPECYVAEIPAGGIPPREGIIPGKALCNIWKMFLTADEDDEYLVDAEFKVKVHNLSTEWITGVEISVETGTGTGSEETTGTGTGTGAEEELKRFQLTWRDKFGRWYVEKLGGGGGGSTTIRFKITQIAPFVLESGQGPCKAVFAEVLDVSCGASWPVIGQEVIIWDPSDCWFNIPREMLLGTHGHAVQMAMTGDYSIIECSDLYDVDSSGCWFAVQHLCCGEEIHY